MLHEISRRKFMELTGAGALLLASAGMMTGCCGEYPAIFGEWIDMGDLRIRFSRVCLMEDKPDGVVFGCTVRIIAKEPTQTFILKKEDFSLEVLGEAPEEYRLRDNFDLADIEESGTFSGDEEFFLYGYYTAEQFQKMIDKLEKGNADFEMKVTFRHNGKSTTAISYELDIIGTGS